MQQPESSYLDILSAERRVTAGFILFVAGIFGVLAVFAGSFVAALFVILVSEYVLTLWRPTPRLGGPSSYQTPGAPTLRPVIVAFRWYSLFNGWRGLVSGSIFCIGFLAFVLIFTRPTSFDAWNYAVLVLFGVWLFGRPLWAPAVGRWLARSTVGIRAQLEAWSPAISVTSDGLDIDLRAKTIGRPQKRWVISVTFAELDEVRTLGALEAQAYWASSRSTPQCPSGLAPICIGTPTVRSHALRSTSTRPSAFTY